MRDMRGDDKLEALMNPVNMPASASSLHRKSVKRKSSMGSQGSPKADDVSGLGTAYDFNHLQKRLKSM